MNGHGQVVEKERVVSAGFWVLGTRVAQRIFSFARLIILAFFLSPYDFGLMGIALLTIASIDTFSQTGFLHALIQKKGNIAPYLNAAWTFTALRGVVLFSIVIMAAPFASHLFESSEATLVIRVAALSILLQSFTSTAIVYFQKDLDFAKQFAYNLSGILVDFAVSIFVVLVLRDVWALVFGLLAGHTVRLVMSYRLHPFRPRLDLDISKAMELFGFGKWILGSTILVFLVTQGDSILVGYVFGATALGLYQLATIIANTPTTEIAHVIGQVAFPTFAKLQDRADVLRSGYVKVLKISTFFSFGLACFVLVLIDEFIMTFMNQEWIAVVVPVQVLVIAGSIRSLVATAGAVFVAVGKPRTDTSWQILRLVVLIALIYPLTIEWGIMGAACAVLASISVSSLGFCWSVIRITGCGVRAFLLALTTPLSVAFVTGSTMYLVNIVMYAEPFAELIVVGTVGLLTAVSTTMLLDRLTGSAIIPLIKTLLGPIRRRRES